MFFPLARGNKQRRNVHVIRIVQPQAMRSHNDASTEHSVGSYGRVSDHQRATSLVRPLDDRNVIVIENLPSFTGSVVDSTYEPFLELKGETWKSFS